MVTTMFAMTESSLFESGDSLSQPVLKPVNAMAEGFAPQHLLSGLVSVCVSMLSPSMRWFSSWIPFVRCSPLVSQLAKSGCVCHLLNFQNCRACHGPLPSDDQLVTKPAELISDELSACVPLMSPSMSGVTVLDSQHAFVQVDVLRRKTTMSDCPVREVSCLLLC